MLVATKPTFPSNSALAEGLRVKLSAGYLVAAGAAEDELGTMEMRTLTNDTIGTVLPVDSPGVRHMIMSEAGSKYQTVYAAAGGKIATSGTLIRGVLLEDASGNNSVVKVMTARASISGAVARGQLTQDDLKPYPVLLTEAKTWDAVQTNIPVTPANDDLGLVTGTLGTDTPTLQSGDGKNTTITRYAGFFVPVPAEYVDGETITVVFNAGMLTTVANGTATIDLQAYRVGAPTVDVCATAAQSINSLTAADKSFTITPTGVVAGELLFCRVAIAITDSATATAVIGKINSITSKFDVKG
ncbi:hypothetical protein NA78x_001729 [Anatilimnocola sp. NA78]|uniref:hypothetical protein n=1 Tax=Anatilimnocola sp. NA78 TaxID=3415683 RepID=UPI003CE5A9CA